MGKSNQESLVDWIFTIIGGISIFICTSSMIPQVIRMLKTKETTHIARMGLYINLLGTSMATCYAYYFKLWELFIPEIVGIILVSIQLLLKKCYDVNVDHINMGILDSKFITTSDSESKDGIDLDDDVKDFKVY